MSERVVVLVDGSNVLHCAAWERHRGDAALLALFGAVANWAAVEGVEVVLAFDGAVPPGVPRRVGMVEVVPTGRVEADDVLARRADELAGAGVVHRVVSSDRAVCATAGARAQLVMDADRFVELLVAAKARIDEREAADPAASTRLGDAASDGVRAQLERMRRGQ